MGRGGATSVTSLNNIGEGQFTLAHRWLDAKAYQALYVPGGGDYPLLRKEQRRERIPPAAYRGGGILRVFG